MKTVIIGNCIIGLTNALRSTDSEIDGDEIIIIAKKSPKLSY